jgi:uncharacterized membrane protein HdeD (DUF308 family)
MFNEVAAVAKNWWLFVVLGVICVITGILAIVWPGLTLATLAIIAGIYLLVAAVMEIIEAISGAAESRAISAILGVIALIAGLIVIRHPGDSLVAVVLAIGIYLIAAGVIRIVLAFPGPGTSWWSIAVGALDAVVGIILLAWPHIGLITLAVFFAVTMLFRGAFSIVIGIKLRGLRNAGDETPAEQSATFA